MDKKHIVIDKIMILTLTLLFFSFLPLFSLSFFDEGIDFKTLSFDEVNSMIKLGADVNEITPSTTFTVLMEAAYHTNDSRIIDLLIEHGARVNDVTTDGCTALMWSSYVNENEYVSYALLKAGSNVNARTKYGTTPLMLASYYNTNVEVIKLLIQYGADISLTDNYYERNALFWAAFNNENYNVLQILINNGANVNNIDRFFTTPLLRAARRNKNLEVISTLINNGADINYTIPICKYSYFDVSLDTIFPQWIKNIVKDDSHLEKYSVSGMNALMFAACENENSDVIKLLIEKGSRIDQADSMGTTALMFAAWNNNPDVLTTILGKGSNPNLLNKLGMTALDFVEYDNNVKIRSSDAYFKLKQVTAKDKKH